MSLWLPELTRSLQAADFLGGPNGLVARLTPQGADIDSFIEPIVVLHGQRHEIQQEQIPDYFQPVTGRWKMKGKWTNPPFKDGC